MKFVFLALAVVFLVSDVHGFFGNLEVVNHGKGKPADNEDKCNFNEKMEARNKVTVEPSDKCLEQVKQFFTGTKVISNYRRNNNNNKESIKSLLFFNV
ncbi:hypothetical protein CEXT_517141 [Caerostris extrusa]|uniref:Uncharacterized protein n=1 Tax=Caerostris extrusa TaxID=172846 RepID=A0AAV4PSB0_CAEEX|nr:hypothetical protein CEXT_517141 [Caerostris extrusa]